MRVGPLEVSVGTLVLVFALCGCLLWFALVPRPSASNLQPTMLRSPADSKQSYESASPTGGAVPSVVAGTHPVEGEAAAPGDPADELRSQLVARYSAALSANAPPAPAPDQGALQAYTGGIMETSIVPLIEGCYGPLLERRVGASGSLALELSLLGDQERGAVVVDASVAPGGTLAEPAFESCISSGLVTLVLKGPPEGQPVVSITQVLELAP